MAVVVDSNLASEGDYYVSRDKGCMRMVITSDAKVAVMEDVVTEDLFEVTELELRRWTKVRRERSD